MKVKVYDDMMTLLRRDVLVDGEVMPTANGMFEAVLTLTVPGRDDIETVVEKVGPFLAESDARRALDCISGFTKAFAFAFAGPARQEPFGTDKPSAYEEAGDAAYKKALAEGKNDREASAIAMKAAAAAAENNAELVPPAQRENLVARPDQTATESKEIADPLNPARVEPVVETKPPATTPATT